MKTVLVVENTTLLLFVFVTSIEIFVLECYIFFYKNKRGGLIAFFRL